MAYADELPRSSIRRPYRRSEQPGGPGRSVGDRIYLVVVVIVVAFLSFVAGSFITFSERFPSAYLVDAFRGGQALFEKERSDLSPFHTDLWRPARSDARGVTIHDPARAHDGLTLYTSGHAQKAFLISMEGDVVHEWHLPYSQIWDESAAVKKPQPDSLIYLRNARLLPNGDLLALYVAVGDSPWGYGLVKLSRDSKLIWKYLAQTHHDFDIGPDGRIYALTHEIRNDVVPGHEHLKPPRIDDYVVVLSPDGEELKKIWLLGALARSPYARMLSLVPWYILEGKGDFLHTNAIDLIDDATARRLPFVAEGQVLLSFREIGAIAVLDLEREEIVWALRGPWIRQHDPDFLPDGRILLFDNEGAEGGASRVLEFDPTTLEIVWRYEGDREHPFESRSRSSQERLANGNTLITESDGGRLFEVTPDGAIVWEYLNPARGGPDDGLIPVTCWGRRIDPASLDADFREMVNH